MLRCRKTTAFPRNKKPRKVPGVTADSGKRCPLGVQEIAVLVQQALILMAEFSRIARICASLDLNLRRPLGNPHFEYFVQSAQIVLGLLGRCDVVGDADEARMRPPVGSQRGWDFERSQRYSPAALR